MTPDEMQRMDREAKGLLRASLPLLDAGERDKAGANLTRAIEMMQSVADGMNRYVAELEARIAADEKARREAATPPPGT